MLLALVESLRCPAAHEESALVLSAERWDGGRVATGTLGCPVCRKEYRIIDAVADFTGGAASPADSTGAPAVEAGDEAALRLVAQLDLHVPGGIVVLAGRYAALANAVDDLAGVTCVVLGAAAISGAGVALWIGERIPIAGGRVRGVAADASHATEGFLSEAVRITTRGGRIVAPALASVPEGAELLARDDREWVARVDPPGEVLPLRRSRSA